MWPRNFSSIQSPDLITSAQYNIQAHTKGYLKTSVSSRNIGFLGGKEVWVSSRYIRESSLKGKD